MYGIMATFGAVRVSKRFAADALRTIGDIMKTAEAWNIELKDQHRPKHRRRRKAAGYCGHC